MIRRPRYLVGFVAVVAATSTVTAQEPGITRRDLVDGSWRLAGIIFPMMPAGGFRITFRDDSTVLASNLGGVSTWSLTDGVLRLHGGSGEVYYRFDWLPRARVFRDCSRPGTPSLVIFQNEALSSNVSYVRCETGPSEPPRNFGVSCRLEVVPARIRQGEAVEFHYLISSPDSQRVSGRYFRLDEETFGHSIRLRTNEGEEYRFLRTLLFSYVAHFDTDSGEVTPRTYRFRFPSQPGSENARVVAARDWNRTGFANDSATYAERGRVFAVGAMTVPPGSYVVSAELPYTIFWTGDRSPNGIAPAADALSCTSARLDVMR